MTYYWETENSLNPRSFNVSSHEEALQKIAGKKAIILYTEDFEVVLYEGDKKNEKRWLK